MTSDPKQPLISVCIPTYEMYGIGHIFLKNSLERLTQQSFKDFNVIISDYSKDEVIKELCDSYAEKLTILYFKNTDPVGGMSANSNNVITHATGKIIKLLFQDDFLYSKKSLKQIADNFDLSRDKWLVTGCNHSADQGKTFYRDHYPRFKQNIQRGHNTVGSPSVMAMINDDLILFDTNLKFYMDCDYYRRMHDKYGEPRILNKINVVIGTGRHQTTNNEATAALRESEYDYVIRKFNDKTPAHDVTLVSVSGLDPTRNIPALLYSLSLMKFKEVLLIGHTKPENLDPRITFKECAADELASTDPKNTKDYSHFIAYSLHKYINTDYALIVHKDAHVLRPEKWSDEFFDYDYIGAPWRAGAHHTPSGKEVRIGNGGFAFRSIKLMRALEELNLPFTDMGTGYFNEDGLICVYYRDRLEEHGIKFPPVPLAARFSLEKQSVDSDLSPFGFHDNRRAIPLFFFLKHRLREFRRARRMRA